MRAIATDEVPSVVSVGLVREPCKHGWTDRDAVWELTCVSLRNHVLERSRSPQKLAIFGGFPTHWKAFAVCLLRCSQQKDHLIVNNDTTRNAAFYQNSLTTCYY